MRNKIEFIIENLSSYFSLFERQVQHNKLDMRVDNTIWFFGCSHVWGDGLETYQSAPYVLSTLINEKVINFGRPASGPMMVEHLLDILLKKYTPKMIIIAWPSLDRWQTKEKMVPFPVLWGPWSADPSYRSKKDHFGTKRYFPKSWEKYINLLETKEVQDINLEVITRTREKIKNFPLIEFTYDPQYPCRYDERVSTPLSPPWLDKAKDNLHPGIHSQRKIAEWLKEQIGQLSD